jgi:hypothetical protein
VKWTEGLIHLAMRNVLGVRGWTLVAGEYPGGSDHDLYPLNVVCPTLARDESPDPRRHSLGEVIPDLVALRGRALLIAEAKVRYSEADRRKLTRLLGERRGDLLAALRKFADDRRVSTLLPVETLDFHPTLVFSSVGHAPTPPPGFSYLRLTSTKEGAFEGVLAAEST